MKIYARAGRLQLLVAAAIAMSPMSGFAAQGEVCSTPPKAFNAGNLNDETVFQCKTAGNVTIPQLYAKGWRVVSVMPLMVVNPSNPMDQKASWTVIIEKI